MFLNEPNMSSSTMPESFAIRLQNVSKIYRLHGSQRDQLIDVLGLQRFGLKTKTAAKEFAALSDISLDVPRGHRIGIIGRNGAGKTTLLKLICGNFAPSQGVVEISGSVQALMSVGLGFHPEYTGRENVEASLQYNGLTRNEHRLAMDDIIEFCELDEFLDQPFKTYSMGMQARLMFAAATAIQPDIIIIDEVLGAGDAYFIAKSKQRIEKLVDSGCTMLLVSHSMQQVLELCDDALWLHNGQAQMQGPVFDVVKAYESYLHGPIGELASSPASPVTPKVTREPETAKDKKNQTEFTALDLSKALAFRKGDVLLQEPVFLPHASQPQLPSDSEKIHFNFAAPGGISRWAATRPGELEFSGFTIIGENGETNIVRSLRPVKLVFYVKTLKTGYYSCRYNVNISNSMGQIVCSIRSPKDDFELSKGSTRKVTILLNPLQLGPGDYIVGMAILSYGTLELQNTAERYDLLSRSFQFKVENPSSWELLKNQFFHSAEWNFK